MIRVNGQGMVAISAHLTHEGISRASEWICSRASCEELEANKKLGLQMPLECPFCGEVLQGPAIVATDNGWIQVSTDGIEELERRGIEFS